MKAPRAAISPPDARIDPRGIRLTRSVAGRPAPYEGILEFLISCDGSSPIPFGFEPASEAGTSGRLVFIGSFPDPSAGFTCQVTLVPSPTIGGFAVEFEVENTGEDVSIRLEVRLHLPGEADPRWLIPGLFHGENRPAHSVHLFPGYSEIKRDPTGFWSNHWSFRSDRTSLPAVFCTNFSGTAFLATDEMAGQTPNQHHGMAMTSLALSGEDGELSISISLPAVEEPVRAVTSTGDQSAVIGSMLLERGVPVNWRFEAGLISGGFPEREMILRALYHDRWGRNPLRPKVSSMEAENLAIDGMCKWHLDAEKMMLREKSLGEREESAPGSFRVGERNGVFPAFVLLWHGRDNKDASPVRVAHELLDSISQCIAPCGSFYEDYADIASPGGTATIVRARPVAEAVLFMVRAMRLEMQANTAHPLWSSAVLSNLNFIVSAQREDGAFPTAWNAETGEPSNWEGSDGIAWIAPLAAAGQVTGSREWLDAARRGALHYRASVEEGFLTGSVESHDGVPSCPAAHWALISYILLYEADHDPSWLELARRAADVALTWRMSHNIEFAPASMLAQSAISTFGGDILSAAQPLLGPWGLLSYGEMLRLSALTEDDVYEQRAREGRLYASQLLARTDGEFNLRKGQTLGPISCTDGVIPKGLALKESLVWINAVVAYAALLERNQMISREALAGDPQSLAELALRGSVVTIKPDLELPETAASRRSRESDVRRVPSTVRHISPTAKTPSAPFEKLKEFIDESTPAESPVPESHSKLVPPTRTSSSGVMRMPSFPKEIHEPRRSTEDSQATDERPAPPPLKGRGAPLPPTPSVASTGEESSTPGPPIRIPGAPVGKDPLTNQNVYISSPVMAAQLRREAEERLKAKARERPDRKFEIPVHRGYRAPADDAPPIPSATPPPEHQSHESVPQELWVERPAELPKWHVYQYGLEHVKPLPEEEDSAPMPPRVPSSAEISRVESPSSDESAAQRKPKFATRIPLEHRHSPLPKEDSQVETPVPQEARKRNSPSPSRGVDHNPYRLPTGVEDNLPDSRDSDPADPSKIKWKIF